MTGEVRLGDTQFAPPPLSEAQVLQFRDCGYLPLARLIDADQVAVLRGLLLALFDGKAGRDEGNQFDMLGLDADGVLPIQPQIVMPSLYAPLLKLPHLPTVEAIARRLLGPDAEFIFDHSILKLAGANAATPWHQDEAYSHDPHFHFEQLSFWIPLQDVDADNGCLHYLPGSNLGPLLPHQAYADEPKLQAIECLTRHFDERAAVAVPLAAGDCVVHHGRTLHWASVNRSAGDRLVYVIVFRGPVLARLDPLQVPWLAARQTAGIGRSRHWRSHGGYRVLLRRWLGRTLSGSWRQSRIKLRRLLRRLAVRWQRLQRRRSPG